MNNYNYFNIKNTVLVSAVASFFLFGTELIASAPCISPDSVKKIFK